MLYFSGVSLHMQTYGIHYLEWFSLPALTWEIFLYASITHVVEVESEGVVNFLDGI